MQKVLRINLNSRNQALKRARKGLFRRRKVQEKEYEQWQLTANKKSLQYVKDERKQRREDWLLGPLAPDRDTGTTRGALGTMDPILMQRSDLPKHTLGGPRLAKEVKGRWTGLANEEAWVGEGNEGNIVIGDRVCVVNGPERVRGRIGTVKDLSRKKGEITIEGVNIADVELPPFVSQKQSAGKRFNSMEAPVRIEDVRLIVRMDDEDVIIRHLRGGPPHTEPQYGSSTPWHTRYISGTDTEIKWPEPEILDFQKESMDTSRTQVEDETYMPSVTELPLPEGVEDELIMKYSKKRTTHTQEYLARKIVEDARSKWYEERRLVSPRVEAQEKRRQEKKGRKIEGEVWEAVRREMVRKDTSNAARSVES